MKKIVALLIAFSMLLASCGVAELAEVSALVSNASVKAALNLLGEVFEGSAVMTYDDDGCERLDVHFSGAGALLDFFAQIGSNGVVVGSGDEAVEIDVADAAEALQITLSRLAEAYPEVVSLFKYVTGEEFSSDLAAISNLLITEINRLTNCMAQAELISVSENGDMTFRATLQQLVGLAALYLESLSQDENVFMQLSALNFWSAMGRTEEEISSLFEILPELVGAAADELHETQLSVSGEICVEILASGEIHIQAKAETFAFELDYSEDGLKLYLANETPNGFTVTAALNADGFTVNASENRENASCLNLTANENGVSVDLRLIADDLILTGSAEFGAQRLSAAFSVEDGYDTASLQILASEDALLADFSKTGGVVSLHITESNVDFSASLTDDFLETLAAEYHEDRATGVYSGAFRYSPAGIDLVLDGTGEGFRVTGVADGANVLCECKKLGEGGSLSLTIAMDSDNVFTLDGVYNASDSSLTLHADFKAASPSISATADFEFGHPDFEGVILMTGETTDGNGETTEETHELRLSRSIVETEDSIAYRDEATLDGELVGVYEYGVRKLSDEDMDVEIFLTFKGEDIGTVDVRLPLFFREDENGFIAKASLRVTQDDETEEVGSLEISLTNEQAAPVPHASGTRISAEEISDALLGFISLVTGHGIVTDIETETDAVMFVED